MSRKKKNWGIDNTNLDMIISMVDSDENKEILIPCCVLTATQVLPCDAGLGNIKYSQWLHL